MIEIQKLVIDITSECNRKCAYCFNREYREKLPVKTELDSSAFKRIIDDACPKEVALSGGEPLLRLEKTIGLVYFCSTKGIITKIYSNGILLNENVIDRLNKAGLHYLQIHCTDLLSNQNVDVRGFSVLNLPLALKSLRNTDIRLNLSCVSLNQFLNIPQLLTNISTSLRSAQIEFDGLIVIEQSLDRALIDVIGQNFFIEINSNYLSMGYPVSEEKIGKSDLTEAIYSLGPKTLNGFYCGRYTPTNGLTRFTIASDGSLPVCEVFRGYSYGNIIEGLEVIEKGFKIFRDKNVNILLAPSQLNL